MRKYSRFGYVDVDPSDCVQRYPILSLHRSLARLGACNFTSPSPMVTLVGKALGKVRLRRKLWSRKAPVLLVALMGEEEHRFFPYGCFFECVFYCYDCWPSRYDWWQEFFERYRTTTAFFPAKTAATAFAKRCPGMRTLWVPEATDPLDYRTGERLKDRRIHVLELGRRHEGIHRKLRPYLEAMGYAHLYEPVKGTLVFSTKEAFVEGLSQSMISLCFPCSMTHPERSGDTETVTHRFFESMASKCLLVGHCPAELHQLFGYNPVIELESATCIDQIQYIISHIDDFQDLVDRNYAAVLAKGTWDARAASILKTLEAIYTACDAEAARSVIS